MTVAAAGMGVLSAAAAGMMVAAAGMEFGGGLSGGVELTCSLTP